MKSKYKLFKLNPNEDVEEHWEFIITNSKETKGTGVVVLTDINLTILKRDAGFSTDDEFLDKYEFILGFSNLEELKENFPEEFI